MSKTINNNETNITRLLNSRFFRLFNLSLKFHNDRLFIIFVFYKKLKPKKLP